MYYLNNISKYNEYKDQVLEIVKKEIANGIDNGYICQHHEECLFNIKEYFKGHELSYRIPLSVPLIHDTDKYIFTSFLPYYLGARNMLVIMPHKMTGKKMDTYMRSNEEYLQQSFTDNELNVLPSISLFPNNFQDVKTSDTVLAFVQKSISLKKLKNESILAWLKQNSFYFDLIVVVDSHCYEERIINVFTEYFETSRSVFLSYIPLE